MLIGFLILPVAELLGSTEKAGSHEAHLVKEMRGRCGNIMLCAL